MRIEPTKLIIVGTRITYEAAGNAGSMCKNKNQQPQLKKLTNKKCTSTTTPSANKISSSCDDVVYTTAVQIRAQYVSQLKTVVRAETFESWPSENPAEIFLDTEQ